MRASTRPIVALPPPPHQPHPPCPSSYTLLPCPPFRLLPSLPLFSRTYLRACLPTCVSPYLLKLPLSPSFFFLCFPANVYTSVASCCPSIHPSLFPTPCLSPSSYYLPSQPHSPPSHSKPPSLLAAALFLSSCAGAHRRHGPPNIRRKKRGCGTVVFASTAATSQMSCWRKPDPRQCWPRPASAQLRGG